MLFSFACLLGGCVTSPNMLACLRDGFADTIVRTATLRSCRSNLLSHPVAVYWPTSSSTDNITPAGQPPEYQSLL